eukprot:1634827-Amphidinium_carterae.1
MARTLKAIQEGLFRLRDSGAIQVRWKTCIACAVCWDAIFGSPTKEAWAARQHQGAGVAQKTECV